MPLIKFDFAVSEKDGSTRVLSLVALFSNGDIASAPCGRAQWMKQKRNLIHRCWSYEAPLRLPGIQFLSRKYLDIWRAITHPAKQNFHSDDEIQGKALVRTRSAADIE
jgi:hypothetical protein